MRRRILPAICLFAVLAAPGALATDSHMVTWCDHGEQQPLDCVTSLRDRFAGRGPAAFVTMGTQLSKALVAQPDAFFVAMRDDPLAFADWKNTLTEHTFRVAAKPGTIEADLQEAYLERLREMMRESAEAYEGDSRFAAMAQDIVAALDGVTIVARR